jgi:hypothetical protein
MKPLIAAVALTTFSFTPGLAQSALVSDALISLSVLDIIALFFFVPLALLVADRFVRGRTVRKDADASIRTEPAHHATRESSDRYGQIISDLKRYALQPRWLADSRGRSRSRASTAAQVRSEGAPAAGSEDSSTAKSRSENREDHRSGVGAS